MELRGKEKTAKKKACLTKQDKDCLRKEAKLAEQERLHAEKAVAAAAKLVETTPEAVKEGEVLRDVTSSLRKKHPTNLGILASPPSTLSRVSTARMIEDINAVVYPAGIISPANDLNLYAKHGKFRYDRIFLLQFMNICNEKPDNLPPPGLEVLVDVRRMPVGRPSPTQFTTSQGGVGGASTPPARTHTRTRTRRGHLKDDRKFKALINELTMEDFDSISDQIIARVNKSDSEKNGRTLFQVTNFIFEKAIDDMTRSEMYARLCRKIMERISQSLQFQKIKNAEGRPVAGGQLLCKFLADRCEDFERGCIAKEATTAVTAATSSLEYHTAEKRMQGGHGTILYSDEYYAAQKAKRQGFMKFIGELFKLQLVTERMIHNYVEMLLEQPDEEEIKSLRRLLYTVGAILDSPKARRHIDLYFSRMKELTERPNVSIRVRLMLQDVLELRARKWVGCNAYAAPTIATTSPQVRSNGWAEF